jgi:threonine/homoserine/homoserine lactone efflux protein
MNEFAFWASFLGAALAINLTPGPDIAYILSRTLAEGRRAGVASSLGVCSGALVHVLLAALGVAAMLAAAPHALLALQLVGAAYLVWLGVSALRSSQVSTQAIDTYHERSGSSLPKIYLQGVAIDILNPKVSIFFMAFLPQFVRPDFGPPSFQIGVLGGVVVLVSLAVEIPLVLMASRASTGMRQSTRLMAGLRRVMGVTMLLIAGRLIWQAWRDHFALD